MYFADSVKAISHPTFLFPMSTTVSAIMTFAAMAVTNGKELAKSVRIAAPRLAKHGRSRMSSDKRH
jgi:hypothetical protein